MKMIFYKEFGVTALEPMEWIRRVNKSGLLNLLWVPHYHRSNINSIVINQLLCLVHDRCLWINASIPITDMLIHEITLLPHLGLNPAKAFGRKTRECDLIENMKDKFKLVKKPCKYSINSIIDPAIRVSKQILVVKVMRKSHANKVLAPMVLLAA